MADKYCPFGPDDTSCGDWCPLWMNGLCALRVIADGIIRERREKEERDGGE